jgi:hypothetical protein
MSDSVTQIAATLGCHPDQPFTGNLAVDIRGLIEKATTEEQRTTALHSTLSQLANANLTFSKYPAPRMKHL